MIINANELLRKIRATGAEGFNHKKLCDLLSGIRGTFSKKDIQLVRKVIKEDLTITDKNLHKLENN